MALHIPFDNSYARLPEGFFAKHSPTPVHAPSLIAFNEDLAAALKISEFDDPDLANLLGGNAVPLGAEPLAQLYAGHQFGQYNPQLGDGRALLLGEVLGKDGKRYDIQLKGSGPTPFSRRGDGRAWLGPVLREYVVSEAMHALGVPTTRALAAVRTGEDVYREAALPGAVLTRVASSHIRVGTFQVFSAARDTDRLQTLYDYTVQRHFPGATGPEEVLMRIQAKQALLVCQWLSLGFIHGVMNTDNCAISGETIDYGPCAFMDRFDPDQKFSSIDRHGRYAYGQQTNIIVWNMAQLATALVPLMPDTEAAINSFTEIVHSMPKVIEDNWLILFARKLGILAPVDEDNELITDLLSLMHSGQADFTNTFRALSDGSARDQFVDPKAFDIWEARWRERIASEPDAEATMRAHNPAFIPRNHRIEDMIQAAVQGDDSLFHRMNEVYANPYEDQPEHADLRKPPTQDEIVPATFCGT